MQLLSRMKTSRRRLLKFSLLGGIMAAARGVFAAPMGVTLSPPDPLKSLPAFLDTLLPEDGTSPSASALGVHHRVVDGVRSSRGRRLMAWGCAWLDREARRQGAADFTSLPQSARDAIVARAEAAPQDRGEYIFFDSVRTDAFRHYYSNPGSWPTLGYDGPPQPVGFPDHASPPNTSR